MTPTMPARVAIGAVVGLTWAGGLRAWMAELAGFESSVTARTLVFVLLPGCVLGGLLGLAWGQRGRGRTPSRGLVLSPLVLAVVLLDPEQLSDLFSNGQGGGAILLPATALAGGILFSHRRWSAGRVACGLLWMLGMTGMLLVGSTMAGPLSTPAGLWVCFLGGSLLAVLSIASALPHRGGPAPGPGSLPWVGAVAGLAWAASLRGLMAGVAGYASTVTWSGTFAFILLPGMATGALLGWAELQRRRGRRRPLLVAAPVAFGAVLVPQMLTDPGRLLPLAEFCVVLLIVIGGAYALVGPRTLPRLVCGVAFLGALVGATALPSIVGGSVLALGTPAGIWLALLLDGLLVTAALGASVALRPAQAQTSAREGSARMAATSAR